MKNLLVLLLASSCSFLQKQDDFERITEEVIQKDKGVEIEITPVERQK